MALLSARDFLFWDAFPFKRQREDDDEEDPDRLMAGHRAPYVAEDYIPGPWDDASSPEWAEYCENETKRKRAHLKPTYEDAMPQLAKIYLRLKEATNNFEAPTDLNNRARSDLRNCRGDWGPMTFKSMSTSVNLYDDDYQKKSIFQFCRCCRRVDDLASRGFLSSSFDKALTAISFKSLKNYVEKDLGPDYLDELLVKHRAGKGVIKAPKTGKEVGFKKQWETAATMFKLLLRYAERHEADQAQAALDKIETDKAKVESDRIAAEERAAAAIVAAEARAEYEKIEAEMMRAEYARIEAAKEKQRANQGKDYVITPRAPFQAVAGTRVVTGQVGSLERRMMLVDCDLNSSKR